MDNNFLKKVGNILAQAKHNIKTAVNLSMVYTYYEIGRMIVEEEQNGEQRAEYGQYILKNLSALTNAAKHNERKTNRSLTMQPVM